MAAGAERKCAAILAADVVDDGRLEAADEAASTIAHLRTLRQEIVEPLIWEHRGRVVKLMGDGVLVQFPSAVAAVECAIAIQKGIAEREADVAEARRVQYRVGINLGNINAKGDDTVGDEVDNAARLATLAEPGGICIARPVYDEVKSDLKMPYEHHRDLDAHHINEYEDSRLVAEHHGPDRSVCRQNRRRRNN